MKFFVFLCLIFAVALKAAMSDDVCSEDSSSPADGNDCSVFKVCTAGNAPQFRICGNDLAWDETKKQCGWPDEVEGCNAEDFFQFKCPDLPTDAKKVGLIAYKDPSSNGKKYFLCNNAEPRFPRRLPCNGPTYDDNRKNVCDQAQ